MINDSSLNQISHDSTAANGEMGEHRLEIADVLPV